MTLTIGKRKKYVVHLPTYNFISNIYKLLDFQMSV